MSKVLITTVPFSDKDKLPIELLEKAEIEYLINPIGRKLKEDELAEMVSDFDVLIAGTEVISDRVMARARNLKLISRVGVGLDSVDLLAAERRGILVSYTPDAPAPAVADLTLGFMFNLLRHTHVANSQMHRGEWNRYFGRRISEVTIGVIGLGRIGGRLLNLLADLHHPRVLINDIEPRVVSHYEDLNFVAVDKEVIYREADLISLHIPLTEVNNNLISYNELKQMKRDASIINTSRGGIVNEKDLARIMNEGHLASAAIDVFEQEPYNGELNKIERCLLTSHMGSMSIDCRSRMEIEATEEAVRFLTGKELLALVPQEEYEMRKRFSGAKNEK
jgi:D-3-phosphoglycerate dehydrogenase